MHRFYLPPAQSQGDQLTLADGEAHHALHVVRVRRGERVVVLDGVGHELLCEVRDTDRHTVTLTVTQRNSIPPLPYRLLLAQAVTKGKTMDVIVQKATELGVHRIIPILSERSVPHVEEESAPAKVEKWEVAAIDAVKQCGSAWLPQIDFPLMVQAFLAHGNRSICRSSRPYMGTGSTLADILKIIARSAGATRNLSVSGSGRRAISPQQNCMRSRLLERCRSRSGRSCYAAKPPPSTPSQYSTTNCNRVRRQLVSARSFRFDQLLIVRVFLQLGEAKIVGCRRAKVFAAGLGLKPRVAQLDRFPQRR